MSQKLETGSENPANSEHLCAKNVVHEQWGKGQCIAEMHADPDAEGNVAWYDVMFEHGIEKQVMVEDLEVTLAEKHLHASKKPSKKMAEEAGDMPSKAHIMKMCKDGKSKEEICKMHPDCDQGKLKDMIDDCKSGMKEELDVVDKKAVKKKFDDRKDKDIDNDGDEDETDEYLHKRRKAVSKAVEKDDKMEAYMNAISKAIKS